MSAKEELWFVDPQNGDDANDGRGTVAEPRPLRTFRRLSELLPVVEASTTVHLLADFPASDPFVQPPVKRGAVLTLSGGTGASARRVPSLHLHGAVSLIGTTVEASMPMSFDDPAQRVWCRRCGRTLAVWRGPGLTFGHVQELAQDHGCGSSGGRVNDIAIDGIKEEDAARFEAAMSLQN